MTTRAARILHNAVDLATIVALCATFGLALHLTTKAMTDAEAIRGVETYD